MAYRLPLPAPATLRSERAVGMFALVVHVSVAGSYSSTVPTGPPAYPPMAYTLPLGAAATPRAYRAVGMGALAIHVLMAGSYSSPVGTVAPAAVSPPMA